MAMKARRDFDQRHLTRAGEVGGGSVRTRRRPEFRVRVQWRPTGNVYFPSAAKVDGVWWVLRINHWPDHPFLTLFVEGARRLDVESEETARWRDSVSPHGHPLSQAEAEDALGPVGTFLAYGSEVGQPCDNLFCCG